MPCSIHSDFSLVVRIALVYFIGERLTVVHRNAHELAIFIVVFRHSSDMSLGKLLQMVLDIRFIDDGYFAVRSDTFGMESYIAAFDVCSIKKAYTPRVTVDYAALDGIQELIFRTASSRTASEYAIIAFCSSAV